MPCIHVRKDEVNAYRDALTKEFGPSAEYSTWMLPSGFMRVLEDGLIVFSQGMEDQIREAYARHSSPSFDRVWTDFQDWWEVHSEGLEDYKGMFEMCWIAASVSK